MMIIDRIRGETTERQINVKTNTRHDESISRELVKVLPKQL